MNGTTFLECAIFASEFKTKKQKIMPSYNRSIEELKINAVLWWPGSVMSKFAKTNIIPLLVQTQDDFLDILNLSKNSPLQVFEILSAANFSANIFLKHLVVLSDFGGESIQRLNKEFSTIFPKNENGKYFFEFLWKENKHIYEFKSMPVKALTNEKLYIDGRGLMENKSIDDLTKDIIALLLFASTSDYAEQAGLDVCEVGVMLGDKHQLSKFVKQRYLTVSRITGGAKANALGQAAQNEVVNYLKKELGAEYVVKSNGHIPLNGYAKKGGMPFDIVVEKGNSKIGIEVSFQVTTNSTIERKSGQAALRYSLMHDNGYKIAYILDGAGNFQRASAIDTICNHSDCTVAYKNEEFDVLVDWIKTIMP